jgi:EAL domain-containing protein (putative c-di-GMP-specific phosphodiesterase class I)
MPSNITRGTFGRIRRFVRGDGLRMVFQPIADLGSGSVVGFESLARFDSLPPRSPAAWFDDAGAAGLRRDLELAAARAAIGSFGQLPPGAYLTVNASPDVAMDPAFIDVIGEVPGARVVIEITEHALVEDYDKLNGALAALRSRGVRVAIDDAGAGFANMSHMLRIDADLIKLDIEITRHVDIDSRRRALVRSLVEFARSVGATVVAEGIETEAELRALKDLGVASGQGFHLGRPEPLPGSAVARDGKPKRVGRFLPSVAIAVSDSLFLRRSRRAARGRRRLGFLKPVFATLLAVSLAPATFAFADSAAPATRGYWLKQRLEQVRLIVAFDRKTDISLHLEFARRRMNELEDLVASGRSDVAGNVLDNYSDHVQAVGRIVHGWNEIPPGTQARVVADLTDYVDLLEEETSRLCAASGNRSACGSARSAAKGSRDTVAQAQPSPPAKAKKPAPASPNAPASGGPNATSETPDHGKASASPGAAKGSSPKH